MGSYLLFLSYFVWTQIKPDIVPALIFDTLMILKKKLEDLKVLRRSPDLINNVKIGQGFTAYNKTYFVIPYMGVAAILVK